MEPPPPPVQVVGIAVHGQAKLAFLLLLDATGKDVATRKVSQGDTIEGYRVVEILADRVSFERSGQMFVVSVGHSPSLAPAGQGAPVPGADRTVIPSGKQLLEPTEEEKEKVRGLLKDSLQRKLETDEGFRDGFTEAVKRRLEQQRGESK